MGVTMYRSIVFHIVWYSSVSPETTLGVVGCNRVWWNVNVKLDVKSDRIHVL